MILVSLALAGTHAEHAATWGAGPRPAWSGRLAAAPPVASAPPPPSVTRATVYGYHPYWGDDPTQLDFDRLTHLAIFNVDVNSDGTLSYEDNWHDVAPAVVPLAHAHGVKVHLCVTSFSSSIHSSVLPSSTRRATLVGELATLVEMYGADGVNVDFEGLDDANRDYFSQFVEELAARVDEVYLATPAVDWDRAFDYERLARASEGLFIMGYGYHWTGGDPGPNDPLFGGGAWGQYSLEWTVDDYLAHGAPADKIVVGLPLYGQEWPAGDDVPGSAWDDGWSVTMAEAMDIAAREGRSYDTVTWSPYVLRSGTQLWYDDNDSVEDRIRWSVSERGLQGVGFWALTYEGDNPAFWDMVEAETVEEVPEDTGGTDSGGTDSGGTDSGGGDSGGAAGDPDAGRAEVERGEAGACASAGGGGLAGLLAGALGAWTRRRRRG